jgi:D-lactate dehydrogenase
MNFTLSNLAGFDLHGKTVGIIGTGCIGSVFAKLMHGFGCRLLGYDVIENNMLTEAYGLEYVDLPALCREANIISLHTALTPATKHMIDKKLIGLMQHGTMLINTSRGACVNTIAVIEGLQTGQIGFYGADVYENEKGIFFYDHSDKELKDDMLKKLLGMPNVLLTPHQAFATAEALTNIASTTFYNIDCWHKKMVSKNELTIPSNLVPSYIDDEEL